MRSLPSIWQVRGNASGHDASGITAVCCRLAFYREAIHLILNGFDVDVRCFDSRSCVDLYDQSAAITAEWVFDPLQS